MSTMKLLASLTVLVLAYSMVEAHTWISGHKFSPTLRGLNIYWMKFEEVPWDYKRGLWTINHKALYTDQTSKCDIKLDNKTNEDVLNSDNAHINAISSHKAVVSWYIDNVEYTDLKIRIFQFPDCNTVDTTIKLGIKEFRNSSLHVIDNEDGTYSALVQNAHECGAKIYKYKFDMHGNFIDEPTRFYNSTYDCDNYNSVIIANRQSNRNGTYIVADYSLALNEWRKLKKVQVSIVSPDGQTLVKTLLIEKGDTTNITMPIASTAYGTIRICDYERRETSINCTLYDAAGKSLLNTTIDIGHEVYRAQVNNLANGEYILITETSRKKVCPRDLVITKVGVDGKVFGSLEMTEDVCGRRYLRHWNSFEVIDNQYCISTLCYANFSREPKRMEDSFQCFDNEDFIKE